MATYTDNYNLKKPTYAEPANVKDINDNMEKIDEVMHSTQISLADAYDINSTYNTGDIVMYEMLMYKCKEDNVTGAWNASKWERTTAGESGGSGDASEISYDNTTSGMTATDVQSAIDELEGNIEGVSDGLDDAVESLAPAYDSTQTYDEGDIVSYQNKLYECNTDQTTGTWDAQYWNEYILSEHIGEGGSTVTITPETIAEPKAKVADYSIDGVSGSIYAPIIQIDGKASGAVASFSDGSANPLVELKIAISPIQASGTPTPQTPIPIYGWTGANVKVAGANILDEGIITSKLDGRSTLNFVPVDLPKNATLTFSDDYGQWQGKGLYLVLTTASNATEYSATTDKIYLIDSGAGNRSSYTFTTFNKQMYLRFYGNNNYYQYCTYLAINAGSSATTYRPYNDTTYPISWQTEVGTVYAGTLDVTNGTLKARPYYASYNGEALVGPWISSLDKYVEGATPTTGAQVVDLGGTETTYQLTPTQVSSILGTNNIWANTGDIINCKYIRDLNSTINLLWNAVFNQSNTRSLSMMKSVKSEDTDTKEVEEEEPTEEEPKEEKR